VEEKKDVLGGAEWVGGKSAATTNSKKVKVGVL